MRELLRYAMLLSAIGLVWIDYGFTAAIALYAVLDTLDDIRESHP